MKQIILPLSDQAVHGLKAGEIVSASGTIFMARDAAHRRMLEHYRASGSLPFDIKGQAIYYAGPTDAKEGCVIGSVGPTTSGRMDAYTPALLGLGLNCMIGKGRRSQAVIDAMREHGAVYLAANGGAGALIARSVEAAEIVAYEDLGPEAVRKLIIRDLNLIVAIDSSGNNLFETERLKYSC